MLDLEASLGFGACLVRVHFPAAAFTERSFTFWMLDLGPSLGFGTWSLGFRDRFMAISDKCIEKHLRIIPIARAIFHPGDCIRISRKKTLDQSRGDAHHRDQRNVVEI